MRFRFHTSTFGTIIRGGTIECRGYRILVGFPFDNEMAVRAEMKDEPWRRRHTGRRHTCGLDQIHSNGLKTSSATPAVNGSYLDGVNEPPLGKFTYQRLCELRFP